MTDQEPQSFPFVGAEPLPVARSPRRQRWTQASMVAITLWSCVWDWLPMGDTAQTLGWWAAAVAMLVLLFPRPKHTPARSRVRAGKGGLEIDGHLLPRARIADAFLMRDPLHVHVRKRFADAIDIHVGSVKEGRALLRVLGLDVSQAVADFDTGAPSRWRHLGGALGFVAAFVAAAALGRALHPSHEAYVVLAMTVALGVALHPLRTAKIRVGVEGIEIRWLWTRRFLRHEEIEAVERFKPYPRFAPESAALRIVLSSGEEVSVPGYGRTLELLEARIREARKRSRKGDAAAVTALLRRGDRSVDAWASALRAIGAGANAGPRTAPVPRERLFRVVEDPSLPARDRAAAAVALGIDLDEEDRARLRTAAGATAMPGLRVAIETAASGAELAEVEAALAELEEEEGASARARA